MTAPAIVTRPDWPDVFPNDVARQVASMIVGGAPFANTLARDATLRGGSKAYPLIRSVTGQAWIAEGEAIPDVEIDVDSYVVATCKLAGILLISNESIEDSGEFRVLSEVTRVVQDAFSRDLDTELISGDGSGFTPTGVLSVAEQASGPDLISAVAAAVGAIGEAGGQASFLALSPTMAATESVAADSHGNIVFGQLLAALGVTPVLVPALPQPFVYDPAQMFLLTSRDWQVDTSTDYAPAY